MCLDGGHQASRGEILQGASNYRIMVERDGLPALSLQREDSECELGKGKGGGIPRARRDKDLKGAERMERRTGGIRPLCHRQAKAAGEGRQRRRHSW